MPHQLDLQQEYIGYTARFWRPLFELWGAGGVTAKALFEALSKRGITPINVQLNPGATNLSDHVITVKAGENTVIRFALDRLDFYFTNFTQEFFASMPPLLEDSTHWLQQKIAGFKFATHDFLYYTHALVKGSNAQEFLKTLKVSDLKSAGTSRGIGMIFNYAVPEKNWITQVLIDRSALVPEALYVSLSIKVASEFLQYDTMLAEGREYLAACLAEVGLTIPELENEG
jgi:hypothetical protein